MIIQLYLKIKPTHYIDTVYKVRIRRKTNISFIPSKAHHAIEQHGAVTGIPDISRCGRGLHLGGVAAPGPQSEGPVQGCDVGELQQPGVSG